MTSQPAGGAQEPDERSGAAVRRPRRLLIALSALLAVALIGAVAWALRPQPAPGTVPAATAQQAVSGYLDALVAGDADRALQYALNRPTDATLLNRSVLEASQREAALAVVSVPAVEGSGTVQVPAQVTLGGEPATITFSATATDTGWRLGQITSTVDPGPLPQALGATLNGEPLTNPAHLEVFPGVYRFGETAREIDLANSRVVVAAVGEDIRAGLQPTLTAAGVRTANRIAAAALRKCLDQRSAAPQGCPNAVTVSSGQKINAKTIRWNLVGNPWRNATYTLDATDPTQARAATSLTFRFRCTLTQKGETYKVDQTNTADVRYMLTVTDSKVPVVWQRVS